MQKLVSINLKADFVFFRNPDTNQGINLSYNLLHKPALLGILGAILGLDGYQKMGELPQYYQQFKDLKIGIEPLQHEKGNYQKTVLKYTNTIGYANNGDNYLTEEAMLIAPAYRCYILLDIQQTLHQQLFDYLQKGYAEYLPYFGKNEFQAWWDTSEGGFTLHEFEENKVPTESFLIKSIFLKENILVKNQKDLDEHIGIDLMGDGPTLHQKFVYFERLPVKFNEEIFQYELAEFAYSNFKLKKDTSLNQLYFLSKENAYVQLF